MILTIICHTGVSSKSLDNNKEKALQNLVIEAVKKVFFIKGKNCVDGVEEAIKHMESSGIANAGIGAVCQRDGAQRMDASIMYSKGLQAGAVGSLRGVLHPISVARIIMEKNQFVNLAFDEAYNLAIERGVEKIKVSNSKGCNPDDSLEIHGTVGCVCFDNNGNLCAGTSTGGLIGAHPGRIGDSPIIGAGTYCNEVGGVSMTGIGENIVRFCAAKRVIDIQQFEKLQPQDAINKMMGEFSERFNSSIGTIVLNNRGDFGVGFIGERMAWAVIQRKGNVIRLFNGIRPKEIKEMDLKEKT